jgi:hypothetical protein
LTQDEISYARSICGGLLILKNGGVDVDCVISVFNRIIENNTTDGFPYVEPPLTDKDALDRPWVMVRDDPKLGECGPKLLVAKSGWYYTITPGKEESGLSSWRFARRATREEIEAAGLGVTG